MKKLVLFVVGGFMMMSCGSKVEKIQGKINVVNAKVELIKFEAEKLQEPKLALFDEIEIFHDSVYAFRDSVSDIWSNGTYGTRAYNKAWDEMQVASRAMDRYFLMSDSIFSSPEWIKIRNQQDSILLPIEELEAELVILTTALLQAKIEEAGK